MKVSAVAIGIAILVTIIILSGLAATAGSGGIERLTTLTGIYSVCKPDGYPAICFANKSGGGFSCVPYSGNCK